MKKLLLVLFFIPLLSNGQNVPQGINYQAIARDSSGSILVDQNINIKFSIIADSSNTTTTGISWQETHSVYTNEFGLFNVIIGQGLSTNIGFSTSFELINWGASNHLLKIEIDDGNGVWVDMGITPFTSVPYSLASLNNQSEQNNTQKHSHTVTQSDPVGWYLIAECDDLSSINPNKPNMAKTFNSGFFNINTTMNFETAGYNNSNRFTTSLDFILGANDSYFFSPPFPFNLNVLNSSIRGNGKVFQGLYIYKESGKFKLYAYYNPSGNLSSSKEITFYSSLNTPNTLSDSIFQINWNLIDFEYYSSPTGDSLFGYEILEELYQTQPINNASGIAIKGNNLLFSEKIKPYTPDIPLAFIFQLGDTIGISASGRFNVKAKHKINGQLHFQEFTFDAHYISSRSSSNSDFKSASLNLISNNMTYNLISKIFIAEVNTPNSRDAIILLKLNDSLQSYELNEGLELTIYNNNKNSYVDPNSSIINNWSPNEHFNLSSGLNISNSIEEIDLTADSENTLKFKKFSSTQNAISNLESTDSTIEAGFISNANVSPVSKMMYKGSDGKPYFIGSPSQVKFLVNWGGNSSGGTSFSLQNQGESYIKSAGYVYDSEYFTSTGVTNYWHPMADGVITAARLENLNTKMEINNTSSGTAILALELWITDISSSYSTMLSGQNSVFARRIHSDTFSINVPGNNEFFGNSSSGKNIQLRDTIPTVNSSGEYGYFNENSVIGVFWIFRRLDSNGGPLTIIPKRISSINGSFNRSALMFNSYLYTEIKQ